jgi:ATP-dependent exoDNAse (exonuclease V) alpha subunit
LKPVSNPTSQPDDDPQGAKEITQQKRKLMLRITQSESTQAAKSYFNQSLSRGDYYQDGLEISGHWGGRAAEMLGLSGELQKEHFDALLENRRPDGSRLSARDCPTRRPGYDFTFDVPKSVSLAYAIGGDKRILEAARIAVMETMKELENDMHARVRKGGAFHDRRTSNMIWADFMHLTTRPTALPRTTEERVLRSCPWLEKFRDKSGCINIPDPHLHFHVYAMNATYDEVEQMWKAGEFMRIKRDAGYYQAAYHTRLAQELQKIGYGIEPTAKAFELVGIPRNVVELYSRRTQDIEKLARELGIEDPYLKGQLGAKSRQAKSSQHGMDELRAIWKSFAEGQDGRRVQATCEGALLVERSIPIENQSAARVAVEYAIGHEFERVSEVSVRRFEATALERSVGKAGIATVKDAVACRENLVRAFADNQERLTTVEIFKEEAELSEIVRKGRGNVAPICEGEYRFRNPLYRDENEASKQPREAIRLVMESQDWMVGIVGRAGTGKTTLLHEVKEGVESEWSRLVLCAPTAEAARGVLHKEGFTDALTVKQLLLDENAQANLRGAVLWIDEAGMVGNRDMLALTRLAEKQGAKKVVFVGDNRQNRSVCRGDAFRFLEEQAGLKIAYLDRVHRQRNPKLREAVESISRGDIDRGFEKLEQLDSIQERELQECSRELARAYVGKLESESNPKQHEDMLVISPTHREGEIVSQAIRKELRETGRICNEDVKIPRTVNYKWTAAEKSEAANYEPGMIVQFKQHAKGFRRSERVRVESVDGRDGIVKVRNNFDRIEDLPLDQADRFQVYYKTELPVCVGDRLRITENYQDGDHRLNNGKLVTVRGFTPSGEIDIGDLKRIPRDFGHLAHGYVSTADAAQSKTVDTVFASISNDSMGGADMRRVYVTISRAREEVRIFTDDKEALQATARRDTPRRFATEVVGIERTRELLMRERLKEIERKSRIERTRERSRDYYLDRTQIEMER